MSNKVEVFYYPKPCPHCKEFLFRVEKMTWAWSECRNKDCPFLTCQVSTPESYTECYNRR